MPLTDLNNAIQQFKEKKILVIGDIMLDRWTFGRVARISPEAPVPVLEKTGEKFTLGGAGNVANNITLLGGTAYLAGVIGQDRTGERIRSVMAERSIHGTATIASLNRITTQKHRIVSHGDHQLLRLDEEEASDIAAQDEAALWEHAEPLIREADIVILSDYAKGVLTSTLISRILSAARMRGVPVLADCKPKNKKRFVGVDLISPNLTEGREMTGLTEPRDIGMQLAREFDAYVALTLGENGMSVFKKGDGEEFRIPGKKVHIADVSGAGDTVIAVLALSLASGLPVTAAATLANDAGAAVVAKPGTASITQDELYSAAQSSLHVASLAVVPKVWGFEKWLENNEKYCCKILSVNKGYRCSLHYHKQKDETFYITQGHIKLEVGEEVRHLYPGSYIRISPNTPHRFTGMEDSLITEISTHHDEADSYRLEESGKAPERI